MPNLPAILARSKNTPESSTPQTPLDAYIHDIQESELFAINQNQIFRASVTNNRDQNQQEMAKIFDQLKRESGARGFTFLGRAVSQDMTFEDVLKKTPEGELESAASMRFFSTHPEFIRMLYDRSWRIDDRKGMSMLKKLRIMGTMGGAAGASSGAAQANAQDSANQDSLTRVRTMYQAPDTIFEYRTVKALFGVSAADRFLQIMQNVDESALSGLSKIFGAAGGR